MFDDQHSSAVVRKETRKDNFVEAARGKFNFGGFFFLPPRSYRTKKVADIVDSHLNDSSPIPLRCHLSQMFNFIICAVNRTATEIGFSRNSLFTSGMSGSIFCHGIGNRFSVESLCSCAFRRINIGNSLLILLLRRRCLHCHLAWWREIRNWFSDFDLALCEEAIDAGIIN